MLWTTTLFLLESLATEGFVLVEGRILVKISATSYRSLLVVGAGGGETLTVVGAGG